MQSMANRIRRSRSSAKLSQSQLASLVGVQRSAVAQWESVAGGTSPSIEHLVKVAQATGVLFEWLATGRGHSRPGNGQFDVAVTMSEFAQTVEEERALELLRRLPTKRRRTVCSILELLCE
jgi:transcriptional regulator with XRE-family HTH domain